MSTPPMTDAPITADQQFESPDALPTKAVLQRNYFFKGLADRPLQRLAEIAMRRTYCKGEVVFQQGDEGDALYGVAWGRIRISARGAGGREVFLNIMEPGDTFGEIAVMDGLPRTAAATALDATTLIVISRHDFMSLLEREPRFAIHLVKLLCERLRWTSELVEESAFFVAEARLAKRLLILASLHGRAIASGGLELALSQAELGRFLGMSRQVVNRHLSDWQRRGWVEVARSRIVIHKGEDLRRVIAAAAPPR
jgi:CRP/FNR family transcriptional regulator, cyclic AMP receptor protein